MGRRGECFPRPCSKFCLHKLTPLPGLRGLSVPYKDIQGNQSSEKWNHLPRVAQPVNGELGLPVLSPQTQPGAS